MLFLLFLIPILLLIFVAINPIRAIILILRVVFFIYAVGAWVMIYWIVTNYGTVEPWWVWSFPIILTLLWMLTFAKRRNRGEQYRP